MDANIKENEGNIRWTILQSIHEKDSAIECHLRKGTKITLNVLYPGNNKQSVPPRFSNF